MMAQKLMAEKRDDPFSDSRFFAGKMRPSMDDIENPTRLSDMAGPAYGAAATGSLFAPGAGIADVMGYAPNPMQQGEMLPSFGENIGQGKYLDAGLQTLGVAGDVLQAGGAFVPPLAAAGTMLKAPRAARVASNTADIFSDVADFPSLTKSEERVVAASSAPPEQIAGLGRVITEPIDPQNMAASQARFDELRQITSGYEQEGAKARIVRLDDGTDAIQYMEPPAMVQSVPVSELKATQPSLLSSPDAPLTEGPPLVVKKGGELFVRDGHHRLARMIEDGANVADVRVVDLDAGGLLGVEAPRAARVALSPEITRAISRNTDRNAKKVAKDLRQEGLLDVDDRGQSEAFYAEFERIKSLKGERKAAKPDRIDDLERNKNVRSLKATVLKAQKPIKESPMFDAWTKPNRERVLNSTYDSDTIDAEARLATVEAIAREAKKRGLEVYYTSKGQRGRAGSRYIELPDGGKVRVSDHELPDTAQRRYTRSEGIGNFADEIIVSDWETSSVDDYLKRILAEE